MKRTLSALALMAASTLAWGNQQTVTLSVPGMDCPVCPITIKKALLQVPGVSQAQVDFERREATVSFDSVRTRVEAQTRATAEAGYPSTLSGRQP